MRAPLNKNFEKVNVPRGLFFVLVTAVKTSKEKTINVKKEALC